MTENMATATTEEAPTSAARKVYDITELLTLVLLQLPAKDIVLAQRVSNRTRNVILGTRALRQKIFLAPSRLIEWRFVGPDGLRRTRPMQDISAEQMSTNIRENRGDRRKRRRYAPLVWWNPLLIDQRFKMLMYAIGTEEPWVSLQSTFDSVIKRVERRCVPLLMGSRVDIEWHRWVTHHPGLPLEGHKSYWNMFITEPPCHGLEYVVRVEAFGEHIEFGGRVDNAAGITFKSVFDAIWNRSHSKDADGRLRRKDKKIKALVMRVTTMQVSYNSEILSCVPLVIPVGRDQAEPWQWDDEKPSRRNLFLDEEE